MRYVLREKLFSLLDAFVIRDQRGKAVFEVRAKFFSLRRTLVLRDMKKKELAVIRRRLLTLLPAYRILIDGRTAAVVRKRWTFFRSRFAVKTRGRPDYDVAGDFLEHEYRILQKGREVAAVTKRWLSLTDAYGIEIDDDQPQVLLLACAVVIDELCHREEDESGSVSIRVGTKDQ